MDPEERTSEFVLQRTTDHVLGPHDGDKITLFNGGQELSGCVWHGRASSGKYLERGGQFNANQPGPKMKEPFRITRNGVMNLVESK